MPVINPSPGHAPALPTFTRRALLWAAPALAAAPLPALASAPDPLPGYVRDYLAARAAFIRASDEPGGGDFDTPECLHWQDEMDRLSDLIIEGVATTPEGIAAQVEFIKADYDSGMLETVGATVSDVPVDLLDAILEGLRRIGQ